MTVTMKMKPFKNMTDEELEAAATAEVQTNNWTRAIMVRIDIPQEGLVCCRGIRILVGIVHSPTRKPGCHSQCPSDIAWAKDRDKVKKKIRKEKAKFYTR